MDSKDFIKLLGNPSEVGKMPVEQLKKLSLEYPYSQPVQFLYAVRLSQSSEYLFNRQLGKTSILTDDRTVLFDFFERDREEVGSVTAVPGSDYTEPVQKVTAQEEFEAAEEVATEVPEKPEPLKSEQTPEEKAPQPQTNQDSETPQPAPSEPEKAMPAEARGQSVPEVSKPQEAPRPKLDLTGLSPKEKVAAILAENKRIREQYSKKGEIGAPVENTKESGLEPTAKQEELPKPVESKLPETSQASSPNEEIVQKAETLPETTAQPSEEGEQALYEDKVQEQQTEEEKKEAKVKASEPVAEDAPEEVEPSFEIDKETQAVIAEEQVLADEEGTTEEQIEPVFEIFEEEEEKPFVIDDDFEETTSVETDREPQHEPEPEAEPGLSSDYKMECHSFTEWLQILQSQRREENQPAKEEQEQEEREEDELPVSTKMELLGSFVEKLPDLKKTARQASSPKPAKREISIKDVQQDDEEDSLVTETLARVYLRQKHYDKAIKAYEIMKLKYPEKSSFFADQISEIRKLINSK